MFVVVVDFSSFFLHVFLRAFFRRAQNDKEKIINSFVMIRNCVQTNGVIMWKTLDRESTSRTRLYHFAFVDGNGMAWDALLCWLYIVRCLYYAVCARRDQRQRWLFYMYLNVCAGVRVLFCL